MKITAENINNLVQLSVMNNGMFSAIPIKTKDKALSTKQELEKAIEELDKYIENKEAI